MQQERNKIDELIQRRLKTGASQEKVAEIAGVGRSHLALVEAGNRPLTDKMAKKIETAIEFLEQNGTKTGHVVTVRDVNGDYAVIGVGNAPKKQSPEPQEIPDWAKRIESDLATIKDLLLKLLAK